MDALLVRVICLASLLAKLLWEYLSGLPLDLAISSSTPITDTNLSHLSLPSSILSDCLNSCLSSRAGTGGAVLSFPPEEGADDDETGPVVVESEVLGEMGNGRGGLLCVLWGDWTRSDITLLHSSWCDLYIGLSMAKPPLLTSESRLDSSLSFGGLGGWGKFGLLSLLSKDKDLFISWVPAGGAANCLSPGAGR